MLKNYTAALDRAETLLFQRDADGALETIHSLLGEEMASSERGRALAIEVTALEALGRADSAETLVTETMEIEGEDLGFILATGTAFSDMEEYQLAETFLMNLCNLDAENYVPWYSLAVSYGRAERYEDAVQAYDEALERNPDFAESHLQKGYCLRLLGDARGAAEHYGRYVELEPGDGDAWATLAIIESELGNIEDAYVAFGRALEMGAEKEEVYFDWAVTAQQAGDGSRVEACMEGLMAIAPSGWRTLLVRADFLEDQGDVAGAWTEIEAALHAALADGEEEERRYVAGRLLEFAYGNELSEELNEWLDLIFARELFSEEVLEMLRRDEGLSSLGARSSQVVLRSTEEPAAHAEYIVYGVLAEDEASAIEFAIAFQERCDQAPWYVDSAQPVSETAEGMMGVYWRSERSDAPPDAV